MDMESRADRLIRKFDRLKDGVATPCFPGSVTNQFFKKNSKSADKRPLRPQLQLLQRKHRPRQKRSHQCLRKPGIVTRAWN